MSSSMETLRRIIQLGYQNFWRNRWLTFGATLLMTLTLTMISVSLLLSFMIKDAAQSVQSSINLSVYFRDDAVADAKILDLSERIKKVPDVVGVDFISKKQALTIFKRLPISDTTKEFVGNENNPLPRSLEIQTNNATQIPQTVAKIAEADTDKIICADCVSYMKSKEIIDQLVASTRTAQQAGWLLSIFFGLIAIFNVYNIIRLTISARSDEIEIMRYVGASNSFIRGPFIVEGLLYGILGTLATTILLPLLTYIINHYRGGGNLTNLGSAFGVLNTNLFEYVTSHLGVLIGIQLAIGVLLGVVVSVLSIRRYLRA
jgi:cell division transport system permease protein